MCVMGFFSVPHLLFLIPLVCVRHFHLNQVAGIVGRADLLCALFFQLSFLAYCKAFNRGMYLTSSITLYLLHRNNGCTKGLSI